MNEAELALQGIIYQTLRASGSRTAALVNGRVYDHVPADAEFPYVSFGPSTATADDFECADGLEVIQQIDIWSRLPGFREAKQIAAAVRGDLHRLEADLGVGFGKVEIMFRNSRDLRDPDGITSHTAHDYAALIDSEAL